MQNKNCVLIATFFVMVAFNHSAPADPWLDGNSKFKVQPLVAMKAHPFALEDVRITDGPLKHAMDLDAQYLMSLDTDRLLHNFRINAGLASSAQPLGGWEAPDCELRGHFVGHYLSACAQMYASTGDAQFKNKGHTIVAGMAECQAKLRNGYLSAFPETFIDRVEKRVNVWAPYYTLHKILAGLLDMYVYCDDQQALDAAKRFGDWVIERNSRLTDEQMQAMMGTEHGGMNEALANLYAVTGEEKYLKISLRFNHHRVIDPASRGQDTLTGLHANTQIPKFIGTARQFELTGDEALKTASLFFWNTVVHERSYVIGGDSDGEMFSPKEKLSTALGPNTTETCNTYNMLKLTRHLFCWEPKAEYADYYERALYNHILASQNPEDGMMCYYVPLRAGSRKNFNSPTTDFWCCTGTGVENHGKYGDSIYFHDESKSLYVNLFVASEVNWKEKGIKLKQETQYPDEMKSKLVFICAKPMELSLNIRHPYWATEDFEIRVNGERIKEPSQAGTYAVVTRTWKSGDAIAIIMPFSLRTEAFKDNANRLAIMNGPIVLSAAVDMKKAYPAAVADKGQLLASLKPIVGKSNTFSGPPDLFRIPGEPTGTGVLLEPFYKQYRRNYEVYWDLFSSEGWKGKEQEYAVELQHRKEFEARTVDFVNPAEEQNERDHNYRGEKSSAGDFGDHHYRDAGEGGWFSWDFKVLPGQPQNLVITYWGEDRGRHFDILVDGKKLATQQLTASHPGVYFDEVYSLAPELTESKGKITVRIQGSDTWVGGVFGVRVMKPAPSK